MPPIELRENNSQIISILLKELAEPLILIAKIKGYDGIDDYVIDVVKEDLESIRGGQWAAEFGNFIMDYLEKIIPSPSSIPYDKGEEKIWIIIIITIVHYQKKIYKNWKKQNWFEPEKVKW